MAQCTWALGTGGSMQGLEGIGWTACVVPFRAVPGGVGQGVVPLPMIGEAVVGVWALKKFFRTYAQ